MRVAYVTSYDVHDRAGWERRFAGWGGAGYYFARALEKLDVELEYVGALDDGPGPLLRTKGLLYRWLLKQRFHPYLAPSVFRRYARQVSRALQGRSYDVVVSQTSHAIAYLDCSRPVVLWTDAPYAAQFDYLGFMTGLARETRESVIDMERSAIDRSALVIYASDWAARAAIDFYGVAPDKVKVVPWGANLDASPSAREADEIIRARPSTQCKLLFCGSDWENKRGALTVNVATELNRSGISAELTLIGARPPSIERLPPFVRWLGFVDKSTREGAERLRGALTDAHFLLLPSRGETFGHVLCEANAFGVPCLATETGGIRTAIRDGVNGKLYPLEAGPADYCRDIAALMRDRPAYERLARSSFSEFQARLNYDAAARSVKDLLEELLPTSDTGRQISAR